MTPVESLGGAAFRVRIASAVDGARRAAAMRASGEVIEAWHTEGHLAFVPAPGCDAHRIAAFEGAPPSSAPREHHIETILDGPDRDEVARAAKLGRGELAKILFASTLEVSFVGFAPGFGYLRGLDPRLDLPRRTTPRPRISKGALALAGGFCGIYPSATAGGWNLVGRVTRSMLDDDEPLLAAGDRVRLVPASTDVTLRDPERHAPPAERAAVILDEVRGLAFVEDGGRTGRLHQGVPPSGALMPLALAAANAGVGNAPGAAGIERYGALRLTALRDVVIAEEDGRPRRVRAGESIDLGWHAEARAGYVAFAGGIDVPSVLGGRGTHVRAALGGLGGRPLRRGDGLCLFDHDGAKAAPTAPRALDPEAPIRIHAGPDLGAFVEGSIARLTARPFRLSHQSDRMGTRLEGNVLTTRAGHVGKSEPLVQGAIEVPPSGEPIVLGPEHPTTGGYPVVAVVHADDLEALLRRPLGGAVRFTLA